VGVIQEIGEVNKLTEIDVETKLSDMQGELDHVKAELEKLREEFKDHLVNLHQVEVC
jgi:uncharacterized membrane-anchored protein YhcB (DUF1043 family)